MSEDPAELFRAAVEENVRNMSDDEFRLLTAKTRAPDYSSYADPADRARAVTASIQAKSSRRPRVDHNGRPIDGNAQPPDPAAMAAMDAQIAAAQESGDHLQAIALKRQKHQLQKGAPR